MVKKKKQTHRRSVWSLLVHTRWYIKLALVLLIFIATFQLFKFGVNNYNVSLLDRAEIKIRNLGTPKATRTLLQRTCNFRSVKLSNPGSPICDILKYDIYALLNDGDRVNIAKEYVDIIKTKYPNSTLRINDEKTFDEALNQSIDGVVLDINALQPGLECYTKLKVVGGSSIESIFNKKLMPEKSKALLALTSCYKEFMFQTYPEIN